MALRLLQQQMLGPTSAAAITSPRAGGEGVATDDPSSDDGEVIAAADAGVDTTAGDGEPRTDGGGVATTTADTGVGSVAAASNSQLPITNSPVPASALIESISPYPKSA